MKRKLHIHTLARSLPGTCSSNIMGWSQAMLIELRSPLNSIVLVTYDSRATEYNHNLGQLM